MAVKMPLDGQKQGEWQLFPDPVRLPEGCCEVDLIEARENRSLNCPLTSCSWLIIHSPGSRERLQQYLQQQHPPGKVGKCQHITVCVCVYVCARARVCVCLCVCVRVCEMKLWVHDLEAGIGACIRPPRWKVS